MACIDSVYQQIVSFAQLYGARKVTLFGSRARGDALSKSDIDIAIEGCEDFAGLEEDIQSGIVDKFSLQFELGWKLLKGLLRYEGVANAATGSPREILKSSFRYFGFIDEDAWLSILRNRNAIAHVYSGDELQRLVSRILSEYIPTFVALKQAILDNYADELDSIA